MADAISIQELIDARTDAKTLEEAVNGDAVTTVLSRLGESYPTLANALSQIDGKLDSADAQIKQAITDLFQNGGLPATPFETKALMEASALVDGDYAMVTDDTDNNGLYVKTAGAWVKSNYDPLAQAKSYADNKDDDVLQSSKDYTDSSAANTVITENTASNLIHTFTDNMGGVVAALAQDGAYFPDMDGSLQDAVRYTAKESYGDYTHVFAGKDGYAQLAIKQDSQLELADGKTVQESFAGVELITGLEHQANGNDALAKMYFDIAKWSHQKPLKIQRKIFAGAGMDAANVAGCRMPQPLVLTDTTGLFFFTQKNINFTGGSENAQRIVVCDYTIDYAANTVSTSPVRVVEEPALWSEGKGYATENYALKLKHGANAGRILMMLIINSNESQLQADRILNFYTKYSDDDGQTWSEPKLAHDVQARASAGQLIELPSGRLVYPTYGGLTGARGYRSLISDDSGETWRLGNMNTDSTRVWSEPSLFRRQNGDLIMLIRSDTASETELVRGMFKSIDEGENWTFERVVPDMFTNDNTAMLSTNKDAGFTKVIAGSAASPGLYLRTKYRLKISHDDGETFPFHYGPFADKQLTGYSQLAMIGDDKLILGFETASPISSDNPDGDINSKNAVHLLIVNYAEVFKNGYYL